MFNKKVLGFILLALWSSAGFCAEAPNPNSFEEFFKTHGGRRTVGTLTDGEIDAIYTANPLQSATITPIEVGELITLRNNLAGELADLLVTHTSDAYKRPPPGTLGWPVVGLVVTGFSWAIGSIVPPHLKDLNSMVKVGAVTGSLYKLWAHRHTAISPLVAVINSRPLQWLGSKVPGCLIGRRCCVRGARCYKRNAEGCTRRIRNNAMSTTLHKMVHTPTGDALSEGDLTTESRLVAHILVTHHAESLLDINLTDTALPLKNYASVILGILASRHPTKSISEFVYNNRALFPFFNGIT